MSDIPPIPSSATPPKLPSQTSPVLIVTGILFIAGWLVACYFIAAFLLLMLAMANDSGSVPSEQHAALIMTCMAGHVIVSISGIFCGLGFFWSKRRKLMFILFGFLLLSGIGIEVYSFVKFANVAGEARAQRQAELQQSSAPDAGDIKVEEEAATPPQSEPQPQSQPQSQPESN